MNAPSPTNTFNLLIERFLIGLTLAGLCLLSLPGTAESLTQTANTGQTREKAHMDDPVQQIQWSWAALNYNKSADEKTVPGLEKLASETGALVKQHPGNADLLIWDSIVRATLANQKGGLGALKLVKTARSNLEKALKIDPDTLGGSAYASLGTLYHKVPSWPLGFGSMKKARTYLEKALEINPQGLDINFFYADYLADTGDRQQALTYAQRALEAPKLENRPLADAGRRAQARRLLKDLQS